MLFGMSVSMTLVLLVFIAMLVTGIVVVATAKQCLKDDTGCSPDELAKRKNQIVAGSVLLGVGALGLIGVIVMRYARTTTKVGSMNDEWYDYSLSKHEAPEEDTTLSRRELARLGVLVIKRNHMFPPELPLNETSETLGSAKITSDGQVEFTVYSDLNGEARVVRLPISLVANFVPELYRNRNSYKQFLKIGMRFWPELVI